MWICKEYEEAENKTETFYAPKELVPFFCSFKIYAEGRKDPVGSFEMKTT